MNTPSDESPVTTRRIRSRLRIPVGLLLGGAAGFAWYYFVGCPTGTCALQANPWIMTAMGGLIGFNVGLAGK